jgi:uncharacterized spore protein YtfJ
MEASRYEVNKILDQLLESLQVLTKSNRVIGDPVVVGSFTIIPLIQIGFGFGGGGGGGQEVLRGNSIGSGEGGGAGGSIQPIALLVLHEEEIHFFSVPYVHPLSGGSSGIQEIFNKKSTLGELVSSIPEILTRLKNKKKKEEDI